jgi:hypothetical protein
LVDPDPFTHVKKSADSGDDVDLSFLKELEAEEQSNAKSEQKTKKK